MGLLLLEPVRSRSRAGAGAVADHDGRLAGQMLAQKRREKISPLGRAAGFGEGDDELDGFIGQAWLLRVGSRG